MCWQLTDPARALRGRPWWARTGCGPASGKRFAPSATPQFAGATAARTVLAAAAAGRLAGPHVGLWLGPGANVVHYPVRAGREIALVIIAREDWLASGWDSRVDAASVLARLATFHPSLIEVLAQAPEYRKWSLHRLARLPRWSRGRIGLIGDAAHPVLPHLAQGAALALEDALVLGELLGDDKADVVQALRRFESERRASCRPRHGPQPPQRPALPP